MAFTGLEYLGNKLTFYRNGVAVRSVSDACLANSGDLHVVFTHDMNPELGGYNDKDTWDEAPYTESAAPAVMVVEYFRYWKTNTDATTCDQPQGSNRTWLCDQDMVADDFTDADFAEWNTTLSDWEGACFCLFVCLFVFGLFYSFVDLMSTSRVHVSSRPRGKSFACTSAVLSILLLLSVCRTFASKCTLVCTRTVASAPSDNVWRVHWHAALCAYRVRSGQVQC